MKHTNDSIERAEALLAAATPEEWKVDLSHDADDWPCFRLTEMIDANDIGPESEVQADRQIMEHAAALLRGYIGTVRALGEDGHDSQKWMCLVGRTVPLEKANCPGCIAIADFERLFNDSGERSNDILR